MTDYLLGSGSRENVSQAKTPLRLVVERAIEITEIDFSAVECKRTPEKQQQNILNGVSWTMDSRHLPDPDGEDDLVWAIDIYPWHLGETNHSPWLYRKIAKAMFRAAIELNVDIEWGGFWKTPDNPHWQLSIRRYPK